MVSHAHDIVEAQELPSEPHISAGTGDPMTDAVAAAAFTKDHKHRPLHYKRSFDETQTHRNGKHYCWDSGSYERWGASRCGVPAKTQLADGSWWCHVHEPAAYAKRKATQQAKWAASQAVYDARMAADKKRRAELAAYPLLVEALRQIANGHNDPRSLAVEILGDQLNPDGAP